MTLTDFQVNLAFGATGTPVLSPISEDAYVPPGDGAFDGLINFGSGSSTGSLQDIEFSLNATGLTAEYFLEKSVQEANPKFGYLFAVKWQSTGPDGEGSETGGAVPIPAAAWLFGSGLALVVGFRRKIRK